jgi:NAD(P)-dependent dehydrogenase (short-subunit alcohol dehydrogenase family)
LHGQQALVTGGSMGIGAAICDELLRLGASVVSVALEERAGISHGRLQQRIVDLADPQRVKEFAAGLQGLPIDILVNNAGIVVTRPLEEVTDDDFDRLMNLHVRTAILLAQAVVPGMKARRRGRIVNLASRAIVGMAGRTTYAASKAAMVSITRTWALEFAPFGITVNAVSPGPVATPMLERDLPAGGEKAAALAASIPLRRLGRADDVAQAVSFFVGPGSGWITGQNLFVCGGASLAASLAL